MGNREPRGRQVKEDLREGQEGPDQRNEAEPLTCIRYIH